MCIFWERNIGEDCRMSVKTGGKIDRYLKNNAAQARQEKKYRSARFSRWRGRALSWAYLAPSLIGVGLFFVLPFGVVIYYSLINNPVQHDFVGYSNFVRTWENNAFQLAARNTLIFSFAAVPLAVVLSLWLAVIMESRIPLKSTFRTFFLSPMMVPIASVILVWQVLFDYNGLVNAVISRIGIGKVDWLKSYYGPVVIILLFLWKNLGYNMILFMSGLSSVPKDQIEVARLESATETQIFWKIKLRYLSSTIYVAHQFLQSVPGGLPACGQLSLRLSVYDAALYEQHLPESGLSETFVCRDHYGRFYDGCDRDPPSFGGLVRQRS